MRMECYVRKMWKNRVGRTRKHLQKFILPSGDGVDIASLWNDKKSESQNTKHDKDAIEKGVLTY